MLEKKITFTHYCHAGNTCKAKTETGEEFAIDPFVGCAIPLTDEEYEAGEGFKLVGKSYLMTQYSVYTNNVVPHEGGLIAL